MQYAKIVLSTALTVFAFMFDRVYDMKEPLLGQLAKRADFGSITWCALALFIFAFYCISWRRHTEFQKIEASFAILFAIFVLIGRTFSVYNSFKMLETHKLMVLFAGMGWCIFFYMLLRWIVYFVDKQRLDLGKIKSQKYFQLTAGFFIFICWLPQLIFSLPGNVCNDAMSQLGQWFGYINPSNHHPWFMTTLFGLLMSIGRNISDNAGIIIIILFQFLFCAWVYSRVCLVVDKYAGRKAAYLATAFFSFVPMWGCYAATVLKDTLFFAVFALYFCSFIDIFECNGEVTRGKWIIFLVLSLLLCFSRHDGIYRVIPAGITLLLVLNKGRKQLLTVLAGICIIVFMYNTLIFNVLGISKGSTKEMLSIPFQQTARYSRDHRKDISKKEKEVINKVLPYDKLTQIYRPELSDPVKAVGLNFSKRDLRKYFTVWLKMGLRHPGTYLQATINNTYGYYYPFCRTKAYHAYIAGEPINKGFNIHYTVDPGTRVALMNYDNLWLVTPGIALLSNPGTYTWIVLIGLMLLLKKKKYRQLVIFSILLLQIAICIASPSNREMRYAMPLMACTPVLLAWLKHTLCSAREE